MSVPGALHSSTKNGGSDEWITPPEVFDPLHAEFGFDFDACARVGLERVPVSITPEDDALAIPWHVVGSTAWCNPPYTRVDRWVRKAYEESKRGVTTALLMFLRPETADFQDVVMPYAAEVRLIRGRVYFVAGCDMVDKKGVVTLRAGERGPSPKGSCIIVFRPDVVPWRSNGAPRFSAWKQGARPTQP